MWDILGRLEDHRVPANQSGKHLPGRNRHWEVERTNQSGDSNRAAITHRPLVTQLARNSFSKESPSFARRIVGGVDSLLHVTARLGKRFAHLPRHRVSDLFLAPGHDVANYAKHVTAGWCGRTTPAGKSALGAFDSALDIPPVREWKLPNHVAPISRVAVVEVLARLRAEPFAADEVVELFHFCFGWFTDAASFSYARGTASIARFSCKGSTAASPPPARSPTHSSRTRAAC